MRILFYGNCQLGALARHIRHNSDKYQILSCEDYGLEKFWVEEGLFAVWSLENMPKLEKNKSKIIEAVQTCDIFIFQHIDNALTTKELRTENLIKHISPTCKSICFPSFRYWGYLYQDSEINPLLEQLHREGNNHEQILSLLKNETTQEIKEKIIAEHIKSIRETKEREKKDKDRYLNCIEISGFMETNYDKKLIAYDHSHPSIDVYNYYLEQLKTYDINIDRLFDNTSMLPGSSKIYPLDLFYFKEHFPHMEDGDYHLPFFKKRLDRQTIEKEINLIGERI